jgi:hypothetical protein
LTLSGNPSFSLDLEEQLAASCREIEEAHRWEIDVENRHKTLQRAALGAVASVNDRGVSLEDRLQDISVHAREVATHVICYGVGAALAAPQLHSGHDSITWYLVFWTLIGWKIKRT